MNYYVGNPLQTRGVEQYILQNSKGDGMHFLYVRNGLGLDIWISLDRCGDVSRLIFKGDNMGYFSPCGYVAPQYYDKEGDGFLKSFTAGFFTTCGLTAVGSPCTDEGEQLPLHGTVSNTPSELCFIDETEDGIIVKLKVRDSSLFGRKLIMDRRYFFSYTENSFTVEDTVTNCSDAVSPYMIMYHCNMGYPLLSENSLINIPNNSVTARNAHAAELIESAFVTDRPQANYEECCYYCDVKDKNGTARVGIYNGEINKGLVMSYDKTELPFFTEWKMIGKTDYVLGLEPGNCTPDGRDVMRKNGTLKFLEPEQSGKTGVRFTFINDKNDFEQAFKCQ